MLDYGKKNGSLGQFGKDAAPNYPDGEPTPKKKKGFGDKNGSLDKFGKDAKPDVAQGFEVGPIEPKTKEKKLGQFGL